jgi:hypothetical protein
LKWRVSAGDWVEASITLTSQDDVLVGTAAGDFFSLASDGSLNWKHEGPGNSGFYPDSIMSSGLLVGPNDDMLVVGSRDENLYFFNVTDGDVIRRINLGGDVHSSPALSRDGRLVYAFHAGAARPNMFAFDHASGEMVWSASSPCPAALDALCTIYGTPVVDYEGRVVVASMDGTSCMHIIHEH